MKDKVDIVVQGGIWPTTKHTVETYLQLPFVNNVIFSSWEEDLKKLRKELPSIIGKVVGQIEFAQDRINRQR